MLEKFVYYAPGIILIIAATLAISLLLFAIAKLFIKLFEWVSK